MSSSFTSATVKAWNRDSGSTRAVTPLQLRHESGFVHVEQLLLFEVSSSTQGGEQLGVLLPDTGSELMMFFPRSSKTEVGRGQRAAFAPGFS